MILQNKKSKTVNFKYALTSVAFLFSLTLGCLSNVTAQTEPSPATNQITISKNKQLEASSLESRSAVAQPAKIEPAATLRGSKKPRNTNDSKTEMSAKSAAVSPGASADEWHFQFTPYLWIAGVSGRGGIGTLTVNVNSGITDDNVHLNFGFMGTFEARRNKLAIVTDLQYSNLGTKSPRPVHYFR